MNNKTFDYDEIKNRLIRESKSGTWVIELEAGKEPRMYGDEAMHRLLCVDGELEPEEFYRVWHENVHEAANEGFQRLVEKMIAGQQGEIEYQWRKPDGSWIPVRCGGRRNFEYKDYVCIEGYHQDISFGEGTLLSAYRSRHEEQEESIRTLNLLIKDRNDAIAEAMTAQRIMVAIHESLGAANWSIKYDEEGREEKVIWSPTARQMFGYQSERSFPNRIESWQNIVYEEDEERVTNLFMEALYDISGKTVFDIDYRIRHRRKGIIWIKASGRITRYEDGRPDTFYGVFIDINDNKRQQLALKEALEAAEHSNRSKTTFLNSMSHDIRTPMNAIIGYTNLAIDNIESKERVRDYLDKIVVSSKHLLDLINDVLDMSRIESGRIELEKESFSLQEAFDDLRTIVIQEAKKKNIYLQINLNGIENDVVRADKLHFGQIMLNLVSNAIKFTNQDGRVRIKVSQTGPFEDEPGLAFYEIHVKDNGIGMSQDFQRHIFEAFTREQTATVSGIQGTGLGMSITKQIVDLLGGTISVSSKLGKGSDFTVKLPMEIDRDTLVNVEKKPTNKESKKEKSQDIDFTGKRVLLVEDNSINQEIAIEILTSFGLAVDVAGDGTEAVDCMKKASEDTYQMILMDIQMPRMNGIEATKHIRRLKSKKFANLPIYAMTANAFEEDRKSAMAAGMNGHIPKPIDMAQLYETLLKELNR